jgi:uncharacterized damage-inducible protein DinB
MIKPLQEIFDSIERQRFDLINELQKVPADKMNSRSPGKWSVNQVIAHIISGERLSLRYVEKKILAINEVGDAGIREHIKMLILIASQRLPLIKFKAPRIVVEQTQDNEDFSVLRSEWDRTRADWVTLLGRIPEGSENKMIYKHVVAGRLSLKHALLFMREHIIHHKPQIRRALGK